MKRMLAALVFALTLSGVFIAYAGGDMVGKAVEGVLPVWVHGNKLQKDVIVIEGTSYAPVRDIGESLGLDVEFKDNQVFLNRKEKVVLPNYKVMSSVIKVNQPDFYIVKNEEWYYPYTSVGGGIYGIWDNQKKEATFNMPWGKTITMKREDTYSPGVTCYLENGRTVVSLTALGLKPVIKGDEVWLERIE
jgi:hypothetical protein